MKPLPAFLRAEFVESRLLPVVMAFAFGVLIHDIAGDYDVDRARIETRHAIAYAEQLRAQCGAQPDAAIAPHLAHNAAPEVQP